MFVTNKAAVIGSGLCLHVWAAMYVSYGKEKLLTVIRAQLNLHISPIFPCSCNPQQPAKPPDCSSGLLVHSTRCWGLCQPGRGCSWLGGVPVGVQGIGRHPANVHVSVGLQARAQGTSHAARARLFGRGVLGGVHACNGVVAAHVPRAQQVARVAVER